MPWLARAMTRNPTAAEPHRFAARCLAAARQDVLARREYRLAILMGDASALAEAMRRYPGLDDLLAVVPDSPAMRVHLGSLLAATRPADAELVLRRAWEEYRDLGALAGLASTRLALGEAEDALALARELQQLRPHATAGYLVAASALSKLGRDEEAKRELELGAARVPGSAEILAPLVHRALTGRRFAEARRLAETIAARSPGEVAAKRIFVAQVLQAEGRTGEAIQQARSARDAVPTDPSTHLFVADLCASAGRYEEAIAETEAAANLPGVPPARYAERLSQLRAARQAQVERRDRERFLGGPERLP
jgi:tetratricopeptide (TPR) repeat protein